MFKVLVSLLNLVTSQLHCLQVPQVDYSDSDLIKDYVMFVRHQLGLANLPLPHTPKIGIISRKNRRRIVNEDELLRVSRNVFPTELIDYSDMTFRQQVRLEPHLATAVKIVL